MTISKNKAESNEVRQPAKAKSSFAALFTILSLLLILGAVVSLSLVTLVPFHAITSGQVESIVKETIAHLRDTVVFKLEEHRKLLKHTEVGIANYRKQGYVSQEIMAEYLREMAETVPHVLSLYYTNNFPWNHKEGYSAFSNGWAPGEDWDNTRRAWFTAAKDAGGQIAVLDPYLDAILGGIVITLSTIVFDADKNDLGVIADDVGVDDLGTMIKAMVQFPQQQIFLLNGEGLFITHDDINAVMEKNFFTEMALEHYRKPVLSSPSFSNMDRDIFIYASVIPQTEWRIVTIIPARVIFRDLNRLVIRIIIISLGILGIVSCVLIWFTRRMLTVPIQNIEHAALSLAAMDFTVDIQNIRTDEIGNIQRALLCIRDSLRKAMDELHNNLLKMAAAGKQLNGVIVESSEALTLITGNMNVMENEADAQMRSVAQTSGAIDTIVASIDSLNNAVYTQAAHITESSAAIEQMVANITSIRSVVGNVCRTADALSKSSSGGHTMLLKLEEEVSRMREQSATLQNANKTIADMAGQTNILAMNAAIEAAHAGESGRGFAVVAQEIRKLAELSGKESDAVSQEIKKLENAIEQIGRVSRETVTAMNMIFTGIKEMDSSFVTVNNAVDEQSTGGDQILTALKTIQDMTGRVREGTEMIRKQSGSIHQEIEKLRGTSAEVTSRARDVKQASGNIALILENAKGITADDGRAGESP